MQNDKPIIRHCVNCKYGKPLVNEFGTMECYVRYKFTFFPRLKALFCRYYKAKEGGKNE